MVKKNDPQRHLAYEAARVDLNSLLRAVGEGDGHPLDETLRVQIARAALSLVDSTPQSRIRDTAYTLAAFILYDFGDALNDVFSLAGTLELPQELVGENPNAVLDRIAGMLRAYLVAKKKPYKQLRKRAFGEKQ